MSLKTTWLGTLLAVACVAPVMAQTGRTDAPEVRIFIWWPAPVPVSDRDRARDVAIGLLSSAALRGTWQDCTSSTCKSAPGEAGSVTVLLLDDQPQAEPNACGRAAQAPGGLAGTVFVDLTCIARAVELATRSMTGRANPAISGLTVGDLLGAVIAHEVGHVLGLAHTRAGLMRASLRVEELVALHAGHLTFSRADAATMRASLTREPLVTRATLAR